MYFNWLLFAPLRLFRMFMQMIAGDLRLSPAWKKRKTAVSATLGIFRILRVLLSKSLLTEMLPTCKGNQSIEYLDVLVTKTR